MKKLLLFLAISVMMATTSFAQDENSGSATSQGAWVVEINTGFGESSGSYTGFSLYSRDGNTSWGVGGEAGYFILDDLALKAGLGYGDPGIDGVDGTFNWKFGAKYYVAGQFPIAADVNGSSGNSYSPMWVGVQAAYAWFIANNVSLEPGLRYGFGMNDDAGSGDFNIFSAFIGFNVYFN
ncbi:MAG TPA: hypothetical protein PKW08_11625 [Flavobacteriaceae bacterium]|nr:hypothetical protein [Flavobacteriaceae bacterium]MCB9213222.1 hypothetical protein [Alteromonas sp.]HPF10106.1 hypothetical protein [Flavobacteriaceae bacterium]HQU22227.1 hypothetical protein [Flavobacteriaceae bacterium]HQU66108.1 hypothetical protein [Flavobacteriaceae bacterium]